MNKRSYPSLICLLILSLALSGCGVVGGLVPAWQKKRVWPPKRIESLVAEVRLGKVWLTWQEPTHNTDGSTPPRIDQYKIYYNILPIEDDYCLTCPLDFSRKLILDPYRPGPAIFEEGRVDFPMGAFKAGKKYVFVVVSFSPEGNSAGDSNVATLNWPVTNEEKKD